MKTSRTRWDIIVVLFICFVILSGIMQGILRDMPRATRTFLCIGAILIVACLVWWFLYQARELYHRSRRRRWRELRESGIYEFVYGKTGTDKYHAMLLDQSMPEHVRNFHLSRLLAERDVQGVVCGEELVGVVEDMKLTVTVTDKKTARMFRLLADENVTVIDVSSLRYTE